jgi:hypothetical protein
VSVTTRKRRLLSLAGLALLVGTALLSLSVPPSPADLVEERKGKVRLGMTEAELLAALGPPCDSEEARIEGRFLPGTPESEHGRVFDVTRCGWQAEVQEERGGTVVKRFYVELNESGIVVYVSCPVIIAWRPSFFQRVIDRFR